MINLALPTVGILWGMSTLYVGVVPLETVVRRHCTRPRSVLLAPACALSEFCSFNRIRQGFCANTCDGLHVFGTIGPDGSSGRPSARVALASRAQTGALPPFAPQYKVKDINMSDFGRMELDLAEVEMPGLMSCR